MLGRTLAGSKGSTTGGGGAPEGVLKSGASRSERQPKCRVWTASVATGNPTQLPRADPPGGSQAMDVHRTTQDQLR